MSEKEVAVKVEGLVKSFKIPLEASSGLKQKLINFIKGRKGYRDFTPLNNVSFEIEKGDFFGIVGRNGSGKSTLLKTIAGIYAPNKGGVIVNGTLVPFIELGVGFNPELTGRENVFLNGALLGFSHTEMEAMYDDIVEFAELQDFMDERLKNYSSGMQVRLAFSIAIRAQGDILLLDEVLAVGDEAFQRKCQEYFQDIKNLGRTVILVTHDMASVQKYCTKAILIDKGHIKVRGTPKEVADAYTDLNRIAEDANETIKSVKNNIENTDVVYNKARIVDFSVIDDTGHKRKNFKEGETIDISVQYELTNDVKDIELDIGLTLGVNGQLIVYRKTPHQTNLLTGKKGDKITIRLQTKNIFMGGTYYVVSTMYSTAQNELYARNRRIAKLNFSNLASSGVVSPDCEFEIMKG